MFFDEENIILISKKTKIGQDIINIYIDKYEKTFEIFK